MGSGAFRRNWSPAPLLWRDWFLQDSRISTRQRATGQPGSRPPPRSIATVCCPGRIHRQPRGVLHHRRELDSRRRYQRLTNRFLKGVPRRRPGRRCSPERRRCYRSDDILPDILRVCRRDRNGASTRNSLAITPATMLQLTPRDPTGSYKTRRWGRSPAQS
jgi:hypothetical protein